MKKPEKNEPLAFPKKISLEITNVCNYSCIMCPRNKLVRRKGYMDFALYKDIIDQCVPHREALMIWNHYIGEPLLNRDFFSMLKYAGERGIRQGFSTNASLLDEEATRAILGAGVERVEFSLDAVTAATYMKVRGQENFDVIAANVGRFLEEKYARGLSKPVVSIQFLKLKENIGEFEEFRRNWAPRLRGDDFVKAIDFITWGGGMEYGGPDEARAKPERKPCRRIWEGLVVLHNGDVTPCNNDFNGELKVGNVREKSLIEIWEGEELKRMRLAHERGELFDYDVCVRCDEWVFEDDREMYHNVTGG